ncbi:hypothetical protein [Nonomuraea dietziae]|uniref:hypothetical protein n=1 Tax=Nonomuraea dietziae TaxID=65515 RepID=UPI003445F423
MLHWHCYTWTGHGPDLAREGERRPTSPDFLGSPLPPMRTGDWLAKPRTRISISTDDVAAATEWLRAQYEQAAPSFLHPDQEQLLGLASRLETARNLLPLGVDIQWGIWLTSGRFASMGAICCPNKHVPHPCPVGAPMNVR